MALDLGSVIPALRKLAQQQGELRLEDENASGRTIGTNLYAYVRGSPVNLIDPNGTDGGTPDEYNLWKHPISMPGIGDGGGPTIIDRETPRVPIKGYPAAEAHGGTPPQVTSSGGVTRVEILKPKPFVVQRSPGGKFTDAAKAADTPRATELVINAALYEDAPTPLGKREQGLVVQGGKVVSGRSSPDTSYFAWNSGSGDGSGSWSFGAGDPPASSDVAFGGGKPVIKDELPYGPENKYREGAPAGLPEKGDPGAENRKYLTQRSSEGFRALESRHRFTSGLVVMGVDRRTGSVYLIVEKHGAESPITLAGARDELRSKGATDALAWDSSDSATLVKDKSVLVEPGTKKNENIPSGIGFRWR